MPENAHRGIRAAQFGIVVNAALAVIKLVAGIVGNTYALVADAVESTADIFGSLIVWGGLHVAALPADEDHPFGHGKAEALAAAVVSLMLLGAATGIGIEAVREIRVPHDARPLLVLWHDGNVLGLSSPCLTVHASSSPVPAPCSNSFAPRSAPCWRTRRRRRIVAQR